MNKIILFVYLLGLSACKNSSADREMIPVENAGVNISYLLTGNSDTAIVLMHGWCINKEYWKAQQAFLGNKYKIVSLDLAGHGQSGKNRTHWTVEEYAGDVIALIRTLKLEKVILVGHSMSGDIMLQVATEIPEKIIGLIGIDNFKDIQLSYTPEQQQGMDQFLKAAKANYKLVAGDYSRKYLFPPNYADTVSVNRVVRDVQNTDSSIAIQTLESLTPFTLKEGPLLTGLKIPLHLIVSDYTPMNEETVKKYCKKGLFVKTIHGTGHYPMIEKPEIFNKLLEETIFDISQQSK
ncbi:MAG TPA: alpha/beta hydrolase [Puia sp.]|jgi:pimeloyl-ACP methyl ester carboxylesterase|nr:alpha/beta hydrolase [Puia sp.]